MTGFLQGLREGISGNLSALETAALLVLAVLAWLARKQFPMIPAIYSVFLVLYITLRAAPPAMMRRSAGICPFGRVPGFGRGIC